MARCNLVYVSATGVLTLRIPAGLDDRLTALAESTHRTKAFYAREALEAHLEDLEDYYLATQAAQRFHAASEAPSTLDEVAERLGLDLTMSEGEAEQLLAEVE